MPISDKIFELKKVFAALYTPEDRYRYLIDLKKTLAPFPPQEKTPSRLVPGCQSALYLTSLFENGRLRFYAESDALISSGLAALLLFVFNDATPEEILSTSPAFLQELGIPSSLSPSRVNGLLSLFTEIRKEAAKYFAQQN